MRGFGQTGMVDHPHLLFVKKVHNLLTSRVLFMSCVGFFFFFCLCFLFFKSNVPETESMQSSTC